MNAVLNIIVYQAVWILCVFWENQGALAALVLVLLHVVFSRRRYNDLKMTAFLLPVGTLIDGTLHIIGFMTFNTAALPIPFWLAVVWLALATLPHNSLKWLKGRSWLSLVFGALGGPLAYWAGVKAGAAAFGMALIPSLLLLAVIWGVLWPITMYIAQRDLPNIAKNTVS